MSKLLQLIMNFLESIELKKSFATHSVRIAGLDMLGMKDHRLTGRNTFGRSTYKQYTLKSIVRLGALMETRLCNLV